MPEQWISGNRSMDTVRRPLCGCFVLSCMVGGIFRKLLGFRRCLPPARPEKAWPFQAGRSPCTKHPRLSGLAFTHRKKFLRVPRGVFSKTLLGREWDRVPQRESKPIWPGTPFQAGQSPFTKHPRLSSLAFTPRKKFLRVPRGVFSKTRPCREWDRVPQWSVRLFFYFLDCTDSFVYNLVPSTLKRKSFFRSFTGLLFRTFCFPSRRTFGSSVA